MFSKLNNSPLVALSIFGSAAVATVAITSLFGVYKYKKNLITNKSSDTTKTPAATVTQLNVYPVKSCAGFSVSEWPVVSRGLKYDRRWMIIRRDNQRFITQRQEPKMCLIEPKLIPDKDNKTLTLTLSAEDRKDLIIERALDVNAPDRKRISVRIWKDTCDGIDMGKKASEWLTEFLGVDCQLVMFPPDFIRPVEKGFVENIKNANVQKHTGFADGYPFLLLSQESLKGLNERLTEKLPMRRFRPNIVVSTGTSPHTEDYWKDLQIGQMRCVAVKPCQRCTITTVDPDTGRRGDEPLKKLRSYRQSRNKIYKNGPLFGMNLVHEYNTKKNENDNNNNDNNNENELILHVGDNVHVLSSRSEEEVKWMLEGGKDPTKSHCLVM